MNYKIFIQYGFLRSGAQHCMYAIVEVPPI